MNVKEEIIDRDLSQIDPSEEVSVRELSTPPKEFIEELCDLINCHNVDTWLDTPDFIISEYLQGCLNNLRAVTQRRDNWFSKDDEEKLETDG